MFNLLPENIKSKIIKEYKLRLVVVSLIFVLFIQLSFLVFLVPTWVSSFYKEKEAIESSNQMNVFLSTLNISSTTSFVKSVNSKLSIINNSLEYSKAIPVIDEVLSKKTSSITLRGFNYLTTGTSTATLNLVGVGGTRDSLVSFVKSLEEVSFFSGVDLPISNLAKDKNIEFSININVNK